MTKLQALSQIWQMTITFGGDEDGVRRVAESSGLTVAHLARGNNLADYWWNMLVAVHKRGNVDRVIDAISDCWPERALEIADAYAAYQSGVDTSMPLTFIPQSRRKVEARTGISAPPSRNIHVRNHTPKLSASRRKRERRAAQPATQMQSAPPPHIIDVSEIIRSRFARPDEVMALGVECHYCKKAVVPTSVPATPCGHCGNWNYWDRTAYCCMGKYLDGSIEVDALGAINGMSVGILASNPTADNPDAVRVLWSSTCNVLQGG